MLRRSRSFTRIGFAKVALGALALTLAGRADAVPAPVQRARYLMGTICTAVVPAGDTTRTPQVIDAALDEIARLERVMSSWRDDSELARLNAAGLSDFECSADLFAALDSSCVYAAETDGAFDPTIEPLDRAWDIRGGGRVPSRSELARARRQVGWRRLALDAGSRRARFTSAGMGVDLGGIGKGLALDRAAAILESAGVDSALLDFGGETLALGRAWTIAVASPADRLRPVCRLVVSNAAVSTSGQSEHTWVRHGRRIGHILDPRTGAPVASAGSVTVVARSATRADALSTALFVMGRARAAAFAAARPDLGVLWLEPAGRSVRAWRWNLESAVAEDGAAVEWMN